MNYFLTLLLFLFVFFDLAEGGQERVLATVLDCDRSYHERTTQTAHIDNNLRQGDIDAIHEFLECKDSGGLAPLEFNSLKNDLVLCLMRQTKTDVRLVPHLIAMYRDTANNIVWRNYCVQFMGRVYRTSSAQEKELLNETLREVLNDPNPMLAVTGMVAVELNGDTMETAKQYGYERAFELLQKDIPLYVKITLFQICGMNRVRPDDVRPMLRVILKESLEIQLKVAAIAALGEYGFRGDLETISPYLGSSDIRLRSAAVTAERKIKEQLK